MDQGISVNDDWGLIARGSATSIETMDYAAGNHLQEMNHDRSVIVVQGFLTFFVAQASFEGLVKPRDPFSEKYI